MTQLDKEWFNGLFWGVLITLETIKVAILIFY